MSIEPERTEDSKMSGVGEQEIASNLIERMDRLEEQNKQLQQELQEERECRRRLENIIEIRGADSPEEAGLSQVWIAGNPAGKYIDDNRTHRKKSQAVLFGVEGGVDQDGPPLPDVKNKMADLTPVYQSVDGGGSNGSQSRDLPFPLYRMLADLQDGQDAALDKTQRRAARLFERFVNKAKGVEGAQNVSTDNQKYAMTTEQATEILEDEGLYDDVKEQSKSRITGRVMREVQRFTIVDTDNHEECDDIDDCSDHGVIHFRPGKPHTLTVRKGQMTGVVINASPSDKDVRTADDGESVQNSPEEGSSEGKFEEVSEATPVTSDD